MRRRTKPSDGDLLAGTLDMLILRTLQSGAVHGLEIAQRIQRQSDDVLLIEQGSLYPALHRLEDRGWITAYWGTSDTRRRARFYRLTPRGRKQLLVETSRWETLARAVGRVLRPLGGARGEST
ncbi:MAG TPA: PadR family transcriptional regulator [Vicinamibacterales bacterium]|nr:PadR family transcriptional regulator [Vicinamibacterales bacterium]